MYTPKLALWSFFPQEEDATGSVTKTTQEIVSYRYRWVPKFQLALLTRHYLCCYNATPFSSPPERTKDSVEGLGQSLNFVPEISHCILGTSSSKANTMKKIYGKPLAIIFVDSYNWIQCSFEYSAELIFQCW